MDEIESIAQLFVVRIWVEERAEEGSRGIWRGHITHMPGGERRYLKNLDEIGDFISPYLRAHGHEARDALAETSIGTKLSD